MSELIGPADLLASMARLREQIMTEPSPEERRQQLIDAMASERGAMARDIVRLLREVERLRAGIAGICNEISEKVDPFPVGFIAASTVHREAEIVAAKMQALLNGEA